MARNDPALTNFNAGELSPLLRGRVDVAKYANGVELMDNFVPTVQGPARRRIGTQWMGIAPYQHRPLMLVPFIANTGAAFVLEIGDHYTRFWKRTLFGPDLIHVCSDGSWAPPSTLTGGVTAVSGAALVTPWAASDLYNADGTPALKYVQSNDVMWLTHPRWFPVKIGRIKPYEFTWAYMGSDFDGLPSSPTVISAPPGGTGSPPSVVTPPPPAVPGNAIRLQPNIRTEGIINSLGPTVLIFNTGGYSGGHVTIAEWTGNPTNRDGVLSTTADGSAPVSPSGVQGGVTMNYNWAVRNNNFPGFVPTLLPNTDYYIVYTSEVADGSTAFADNRVTA